MTGRVLHADGGWSADTWCVVRDAGPAPAEGACVLPLATWLAGDPEAGFGVWLAPADDPTTLAPHLSLVPLIAVDFPTFSDGRGYSLAALLRRLGYRGELRAIGDVLVDQVYMLRRVGFSSFAMRTDQDEGAAAAALQTFSEAYQAAADQELPYFRRRMQSARTEVAR
jgi:uncharacterized protein (DUF934 family)